MKLKSTLTVLLLLSAFLCSAQTNNRALLVGVAHYPEGSGWRTIHSDNDVELLKEVLSENFIVKTLVDEQAKYDNIINALSRLERETGSGDTVLMLFSCHGQQMELSGAEEPDSLDEALVPYDAKLKYSDTYKGEKHLRDDVLSDYVLKIRSKAGETGYVIVLLDACHSGDSYRDAEDVNCDTIRGVYDVFGPSREQIPPIKRSIKESVRVGSVAGASDVVYIAACQSDQLNYEKESPDGIWYGSLSYAFADVYQDQGLSNIKSMCEGIRDKIRSNRKSISQCPEFAFSDTTIVLESAKSIPTNMVSDDTDGKRIPWIPISVLGVVVVSVLTIYGRRKRK